MGDPNARRACPSEPRSASDWNSELYLRFARERERAARDLIAALPDFSPKKIHDLGCGPGNATALLAARFGGAQLVGVDTSDNMLTAARARLPRAHFIKADICAYVPEAPADLIFSNAALHFAPDHRALIQSLAGRLAPGGVLAVQMPNLIHEASHALMRMVAADGPWAGRLVPIAKTRILIAPLQDYYDLLRPSCAEIDIWQTTYFHRLAGPDAIADWFEGSALRPFLQRLDDAERADFMARYRAGLAQAYPKQQDGTVLLPYPRLFFIARR